MRFGLTLCNHGEFADPALLADLAVDAEDAGWDAVFVWDHVARAGDPPMTDPQVAMAAIAARTSRVLTGPMVTPLSRRRPWKVAREMVALDHLSRGRVVLGVGLGVHPQEFAMLGEVSGPRARAVMLDEALEVVTALWTAEPVEHPGPAYPLTAWQRPGPVGEPRPGALHGIPVWVAGTWPRTAPFRRAARFDGTFPIAAEGTLTPADHTALREVVAAERERSGSDPSAPFTVVHQGAGTAADLARWPDYAEAGVDWWLESFKSEVRGVAQARAVIAAGPPPG